MSSSPPSAAASPSSDPADAELPRTAEAAAAAAARLGLTIPSACIPGVVANLALLDRHATILRGEPA